MLEPPPSVAGDPGGAREPRRGVICFKRFRERGRRHFPLSPRSGATVGDLGEATRPQPALRGRGRMGWGHLDLRSHRRQCPTASRWRQPPPDGHRRPTRQAPPEGARRSRNPAVSGQSSSTTRMS
jgi:hypothetical protein